MNEEYLMWEQEQLLKDHGRYCRKSGTSFDPCDERLRKRRRHYWRSACVESPVNRKKWQRHIRAKFRNIDEESYHPTTHEYWTHGWLTW